MRTVDAAARLIHPTVLRLPAPYRQLNRPGQALACARRAHALAGASGFRLLAGRALTELARLHLARERPGRAFGLAREAFAIHRGTGDRRSAAQARQVLNRAFRLVSAARRSGSGSGRASRTAGPVT